MTIGANTLRRVVAVVSHVPGVWADLVCPGGQVVRVSAVPRAHQLSVDLFRRAFEQVGPERLAAVFDELTLVLPSRPSLALVHAGSGATEEVSPTHWRHRCHGTRRDIFLLRLGRRTALSVAEDELVGVMPSRPRLWARADPVLDLSVLTVEQSADHLVPAVEERLERIARRCVAGV